MYFSNVITKDNKDTALAASCVQDSKTGDIILKLVNLGTETKTMKVNLSGFKKINPDAEQTILTGKPDAENNLENPGNIIPLTTGFKVAKKFDYQCLPMSLTVIRVKIK
jgi:alpha-L-arabinofuranosidase